MSRTVILRKPSTGRRTEPRRVNFFSFDTDFQCPLLAAIGLSTLAISDMTGLTPSQVMYRITSYERATRRKNELSSRKQYRNGKGDIAQTMIASVTGHSKVRSKIAVKMEKNDIYSPRAKGVLR